MLQNSIFEKIKLKLMVKAKGMSPAPGNLNWKPNGGETVRPRE